MANVRPYQKTKQDRFSHCDYCTHYTNYAYLPIKVYMFLEKLPDE